MTAKLIFTNSFVFQLLFHNLSKQRTANFWYVDRTLIRLIRAPFDQLFLIHTFVRSEENVKQVPLVFVLIDV